MTFATFVQLNNSLVQTAVCVNLCSICQNWQDKLIEDYFFTGKYFLIILSHLKNLHYSIFVITGVETYILFIQQRFYSRASILIYIYLPVYTRPSPKSISNTILIIFSGGRGEDRSLFNMFLSMK